MSHSRSISIAFAIVACLFLPTTTAVADEARPQLTVSAGAGAATIRHRVLLGAQLAAGWRVRPHTIWYLRGDYGDARGWDTSLAQSDGGGWEVRTGPVFQHCMISGCHGLGIELGWQRTYGTFADGLTMPPEWSEIRHAVVGDLRWRGELYLYRRGLVSLEGNLGVRIARTVMYRTDPETSWGTSGTSRGWAAGLALIVRR